jgi:predicted alpha/beta-fold hydrolase
MKCPLIISKSAAQSNLTFDTSNNNINKENNNNTLKSNYYSTFWMFNGDARTLFPFVLFAPNNVDYIRRWVKVPLSNIPTDDFETAEKKSLKNNKFESVALDFLPAKNTEKNSDETKIVLLLLAGLTGGSKEGKVYLYFYLVFIDFL